MRWHELEYEYKMVDIYNDVVNGSCYFVPYTDMDYGIEQMDLIFELSPPFTDQALEDMANKVLNLCHKAETFDTITPLQRLLKIKSYKKSTENKKMITYIWRKKTGYFIGIMEREKGGGYSLIEEAPIGKKIIPGDLANAIKNGFKRATVWVKCLF